MLNDKSESIWPYTASNLCTKQWRELPMCQTRQWRWHRKWMLTEIVNHHNLSSILSVIVKWTAKIIIVMTMTMMARNDNDNMVSFQEMTMSSWCHFKKWQCQHDVISRNDNDNTMASGTNDNDNMMSFQEMTISTWCHFKNDNDNMMASGTNDNDNMMASGTNDNNADMVWFPVTQLQDIWST